MNDRDDTRTSVEMTTAAESARNPDSAPAPGRYTDEELDQYIAISPVTGLPYIKGPPGSPTPTCEMVREMLEDFP